MTELLNDLDTPSDAELISRVRGGDVAAYGVLFSRHREAANRLARQLVRGPDADDLTSEAFAKVLGVLQRGGGPDVSFRAYLLTAVRRLHVDRIRSGKRLQTTDDMTPFDPGVPFQDTTVAAFENKAAAKAFASLPERWQLVLWHLEVEGQKPADIAPLLGMSANSVSALAYRAREGLRQAFLTMHLSDISETECRWVNEHLGAFVRKGLSQRDTTRVQTHLDGCRRCTAMYLELTEVNSNLSAIIAPLLLGTAATGYLASVSGAGGALGALSLVSRVKELAAANTGGVVAGAVTLGVATAAAVTFALTQTSGDRPSVVADPPAATTSTFGAPPESPTASGTTATQVPTPARTPSGSPSARPTSSPTSTGTPSVTPSSTSTGLLTGLPSASLTPVGPTGGATQPSNAPSGRPSGGPSASTPGGPTPSSPGAPSPSGPGAPSPSTPGAPGPAARTVDPPTGSDQGSMTIAAHDLRAVDTLAVTMVSLDTTFAADPPAGCRVVLPRLVECDLTRAVEDFTVTLPLDFPAAMVADRLEVTATVVGAPTASADATWTFQPVRTPSFDFEAPVVDPSPVHRVLGDVDEFDFTTTAVLPPRVQGLTYLLGGGARFRDDAGPCTVSGTSTMTCPDVADGDQVVLPLEATALIGVREVGLSVEPVVRFADPQANNRTTLSLRPGVDLRLGPLVPPDPVPIGSDYQVSTVLTGVRSGPVTLNVVGDAEIVASSCDLVAGTVICASPTEGQQVLLTLRPTQPSASTQADVVVDAAPALLELGVADNSATVRMSPDVSLDSVTLLRHRAANQQVVVRARMSGAPRGMTTVRIGLSGAAVDSEVVRFAGGVSGADGEDEVNCITVDPPLTDVLFASCTGVETALGGAFYVDMTLTHPHGTPTPVTFTVQVPQNVDEGPHVRNNAAGLTLS